MSRQYVTCCCGWRGKRTRLGLLCDHEYPCDCAGVRGYGGCGECGGWLMTPAQWAELRQMWGVPNE
jgi:hypothetical protein